jgi:hypothetical protein
MAAKTQEPMANGYVLIAASDHVSGHLRCACKTQEGLLAFLGFPGAVLAGFYLPFANCWSHPLPLPSETAHIIANNQTNLQ